MSEARTARSSKRRVETDWRLENVTLVHSALNTKRVTLELERGRTFLVGHNGVGKSLLLDTLYQSASTAVRRGLPRFPFQLPLKFSCQLSNGEDRLEYEFTHSAKSASSEDSSPGIYLEWEEKCRRVPSNKVLWQVSKGIAKLEGSREIKLERGVGLLAIHPPESVRVPPELRAIRNLLSRVRRINAGVPRNADRSANFNFITKPSGTDTWLTTTRQETRLEAMERSLLQWHKVDRARFDEYAAVGKRLGLWNRLTAGVIARHPGVAVSGEEYDLGYLSADNTNFGFLSDGTLRTAEILCSLIGPVSVILLIEEPETSIHPGLLRRLISEIEAYCIDRQVVISTHSPDVVSKAKPHELRLVSRDRQKTTVRRMSHGQIGRLQEYLSDEGTLGEFIFVGGGTDEE